ncbi:MAG: DEAD/DEAH box helicase, partial [Clostridiales bacterium]|nr:DEAD/DEAH box helicase [Clostridiales bacterium]
NAHLPDGVDDAFAAQRQIATEDFVRLIFTYKALKRQFNKRRTFYKADKDILKGYFSALPFALTVSQKKALDDIIGDMTGGAYMNRLLMGDVGSGKTAVAFAAAYFAIGSGSQCAFIAPTELLARQHYKAASELLGGLGIKVVILTAACAASEKKYVTEAIKSGEAQLIIGTHSLFSENVIYGNLRLVIIDEQHRFGVKEKDAIIKKASEADVLTLSATPIPRALSLALLSELDVSVIERRSRIDDMISTKIVPDYKRNDMFAYIRERAVSGRQAYIVAPRIEDAEGVETDTVKALYKELKEGLFNDIDIAVLHGKSLKADKQAVMDGFNGGSISVLICTTVIEVGIDVKNASVMAVMNAENYGLAALHQLRGRVGRGTEKSYCFLHTTKDDNARLTVLAECGDGFAVSERDFDMRGGGNFLGEKQSGSFENLNNYAVKIDKELISEAKLIAEGIELNKETLGIFREMNYQKYYNIIKNTVFN